MTLKSTAQPAAPGLSIPKAAPAPQVTTNRFTLNRRNRGIVIRQIFLQLFLIFMVITVLFPVLWIISMAVDPRGISRPTDLNLFPANANLDAFRRLLTEPFSNTFNVYFGQLLMNSLFIALGVSVFTVVLGSSAAYAFSRFRFAGREQGMLVFIILLLLPSTGVIIPLYIMFNSVVLPSSVAEFFPALFAGLLIGALVYLVYALVRSFAKHNPDRSFNISPRVLVGAVAVGVLAAIAVAFATMFVRSPLYATEVAAPLSTLDDAIAAAQAEVTQRIQSVAQRSMTADRREERAAAAQTVAAAVQSLFNDAGAAEDDLTGLFQSVVAARELLDGASDDLLLSAAQQALTELESGGRDAALASLQTSITAAEEAATAAVEAAASARANADEAAANLATAQQALDAARAQVDAEAASYYNIQNTVLAQMIPYMLAAWGAALGASALIWLLIRALSPAVSVRTSMMILLFAVIGSITIMLTITTLQYRMTLVRTDTQTLRTTLLGLALAFSSGGLPFAIWNLKGYFDTIPKELEEAALIDGAGRLETFIRIMVPLALPAFAIVILFSFMSGWTEFILSWIFLTGQQQNYTLAMSLATLTGGANQPPPDMQKFAALSILISLPILVLFFSFQRFIVGGLSIGGVKG